MERHREELQATESVQRPEPREASTSPTVLKSPSAEPTASFITVDTTASKQSGAAMEEFFEPAQPSARLITPVSSPVITTGRTSEESALTPSSLDLPTEPSQEREERVDLLLSAGEQPVRAKEASPEAMKVGSAAEHPPAVEVIQQTPPARDSSVWEVPKEENSASTISLPVEAARTEEHDTTRRRESHSQPIPFLPSSPADSAAPPESPVAERTASTPVVRRRRGQIEELPAQKTVSVERQEEQETENQTPSHARLTPPLHEAVASEAAVQSEVSDSGNQSAMERKPKEYSAAEWGALLAQVYPDPRWPKPHTSSLRTPSNVTPTKTQSQKVQIISAPLSVSTQRPHSPESLLKHETPLTVPSTTSRFLKPLVGIDAATVKTYSGKTADAIAKSHNSDAVTIGADTIVLGDGNLGDDPRQVGVLAHELTHAARRRLPRFVPPIAKGSKALVEPRPQPLTFKPGIVDDTMDEEALARRVEARVVQAAENAGSRETEPRRESRFAGEPVTASDSAVAPAPQPFVSVPVSERDEWGGLPAPWEPLPDWVTNLPDSSNGNTSSPVASPTYSFSLPAVSGRESVALAEAGRSLHEETSNQETSSTPPADPEPPKPVAPDLDQLARQVYAVLKRRLDAERRRQLF
jgi:hypothetical protein